MGIYAVNSNSKSTSNKIYFTLCLALSLLSLSYSYFIISPGGTRHTAWFEILALCWAGFPAILLHFSLVLAEKETFSRKAYLGVLPYIPLALFLYKGAGIKSSDQSLYTTVLGWISALHNDNSWFWLYIVYISAYLIASVTILFNLINSAPRQYERGNAVLMTAGVVPVIGLTATADLLPRIEMHLSPPEVLALVFPWFAFVWWSVSRPKPLALSPALALEDILHKMNDVLIMVDNDGKIRHINRSLKDLLEYDEHDLVGNYLENIVVEEDFIRKTFTKMKHGLFHSGDINVYLRNIRGEEIPITITGSAVNDGTGKNAGVMLVGRRVVDVWLNENEMPAGPAIDKDSEDGNRKAGQEGLSTASVNTAEMRHAFPDGDDKFHSLVEQTLVGIFIVQDEKFIYANPKMAEIFGYSREDLINTTMRDIVADSDRPEVSEKIRSILEMEKKDFQFSFRGRQKNGSIIDIEMYGAITEFDGRKAVIGSLNEITERKLMEEAIRHQAYHDPLTSLPNRVLFNDRLVNAISLAHREKKKLAVMFLDLDRFKNINDSLGHAVGDMLLQNIAGLIKGCLRECDTVARMGGDEYTILVSQMYREEDALRIAQKILTAVNQKWMLDGHRFYLTTSIGISIYPNDGLDAETLIRKADTAMYYVKAMGGNTIKLYDTSLDVGMAEQMRLENDLCVAIENNEMHVCYQPQLDMATKKIAGVEALIRWSHPTLGQLYPKQFIHLAEKTGLIVPIGEWVLRMACTEAKKWQSMGAPSLNLAVNVSAIQLHQPDFVEMVENILKKTMFAAQCLKLEITESAALQNLDAIVPKLKKLTEIGVRFAIDDFGMGYSSLNYLKRLPVQAIKIDRSFMRELAKNSEDASIVTAVIAMAKSLNLDTIAEGVETEEQMSFLSKCRCDQMQGYLFSHPLPPQKIAALLK